MSVVKGEAVIPSIDTELAAVESAVYGEEVRGSIHDALYKTHKIVKDHSYALVDTADVAGAAIESKAVGSLLDAISARIDAIEYVAPKVTTFEVVSPISSVPIMKGASVSSIRINLVLDTRVASIRLTYRFGPNETNLGTYTSTATVNNVVYALNTPITDQFEVIAYIQPNDTGGYTPPSITENKIIPFNNAIYFDQAPDQTEISDSFLQGLYYRTPSSRAMTYTQVVDDGNYSWYALPSRLGNGIKFNVGGFDGGFRKIATFTHTNKVGYEEDYDVWRSDNPSLGRCTITVS